MLAKGPSHRVTSDASVIISIYIDEIQEILLIQKHDNKIHHLGSISQPSDATVSYTVSSQMRKTMYK